MTLVRYKVVILMIHKILILVVLKHTLSLNFQTPEKHTDVNIGRLDVNKYAVK